MSLTIFDKTNPTPTTANSVGFVAYKDLGVRPVCSTCETFECGECITDKPYYIPVEAGDMVYVQLREIDDFNDEPQTPEFGWKNGVAEFWLQATLNFPTATSINLDFGVAADSFAKRIIAAQEVGYHNGSYQNLILNSQRIQDYLNSLGSKDTCFTLVVTTYKAVPQEYLSILNFYDVFPPTEVMGVTIQDGVIIWVQDTGLFYISSGGEWVVYDTDATLVFNQKTGLYYEFESEEWFETTLTFDKEINVVCEKPTYKFTKCNDLTIKIEGHHGIEDCRGNYYGGEIQFRDRYRLWASFEINGFTTERTLNDDDVVTSFKSDENYLLRVTNALPVQVAKQLNNTLLAQSVEIDSNFYKEFTDLVKNNETGFSWWASIECKRTFCEKVQNCVDEVIVNPLIICDEPNCPEIASAADLIGELGDFSGTAVCGELTVIPAATVEDTEGNILGQVDAGQTLVVDCSGGDPSGTCDPAIVENSDESFSESIASGGTYVLEDYTVNVYVDEVLEDTSTAPAMTDLEINIIWS